MGKFSKTLALLFTGLIALALAGCGGDDAFTTPGDTGTGGGGTTSNLSISVVLQDANGVEVNAISPSNPGQLVATVTYSGSAVEGVVVTATTDGSATFNPAAGTKLTNSSGLATIGLVAGSAGGETVTVTVTYLGETATDTVSFDVLEGATTTQILDMGNGSGVSFTADAIGLSATSLSAGGTATATVTIVDTANSNALYTTPVSVAFSSTCTLAGTATMDSPVSTVNGTASSTYLANGCSGSDILTATASIGGTTYTATANLTVASAAVGSIEFVSATPSTIALQGTGGAGRSESSTVVFKVKDVNGAAVANQDVTFALDINKGGVTFAPATAKTNASGLVQTVVQSGTVATVVKVTATVTASTISTQSDGLAITTGLADNDSMSLSASILNPEAWDYDGVAVTVTARLADRYNNRVPNGTAVVFTTEGGSISGSCTTVDGACTATWVSQDPRPGNGRATVLATALGEETFVDNNSNGTFDDGDTFTDMPEAFRDDDESTFRETGEIFSDFNGNGSYDSVDGLFNGVLCQHTTLCSTTTTTIDVRDSLVIVMSGSSMYFSGCASPGAASYSCTLNIADVNGQIPPMGTTIALSTNKGTLAAPTSFTVPNTSASGPYQVPVSLTSDGGTLETGTLTVTVTTPKGVVSWFTATVTGL